MRRDRIILGLTTIAAVSLCAVAIASIPTTRSTCWSLNRVSNISKSCSMIGGETL